MAAHTKANPHAAKGTQQIAPIRDSRTWYVVGFVLAALLLAATVFLAYDRPVPGWEYSWFVAVNGWPVAWQNIFLIITALGGMWMAVASVAMSFVLKMYWLTWRLAVSVVLGYGAAFVLKGSIDRARPEGLFEGAHVRAAESWAGFPSAHAMIITIVMLSLLPYLPKAWRWVLVLPPIVLVALSRLYLGVHMPLDVVGGVALGLLIVCSIRMLPFSIRRALRLG